MKRLHKAILACVMLVASISPAAAQTLTTTYANDNSFAGNTFDLRAGSDLRVQSFDVHLDNAGATTTIAVYWRPGTSNGFENSSTGWTLLGTANVVSRGQGMGTPVPVGGLNLRAGETYGIYIDVQSYPSASMLYTNGSNTFSNSDLSLTTFHGKGNPAFASQTFSPRQWNGTIYYEAGFTSCAAEGFSGGKLTMCRKICEIDQSPSTLTSLIRLYRAAYREDPPCAN